MTETEKIVHALNNLKNSITGLYLAKDKNEQEILELIQSTEEMSKQIKTLAETMNQLVIKIDGDKSLDVVGLRKRIEYLETRDKWLKSKWMYAVGVTGGITICYGAFKIFDQIIDFYKKLQH